MVSIEVVFPRLGAGFKWDLCIKSVSNERTGYERKRGFDIRNLLIAMIIYIIRTQSPLSSAKGCFILNFLIVNYVIINNFSLPRLLLFLAFFHFSAALDCSSSGRLKEKHKTKARLIVFPAAQKGVLEKLEIRKVFAFQTVIEPCN